MAEAVAEYVAENVSSVQDLVVGGKYLTFLVGDLWCGLRTSSFRGIEDHRGLVPLDGAPCYVAGLITSRSSYHIIRVMDLGLRLGFSKMEPGGDSSIVTIDGGWLGSPPLRGLLVRKLGPICDIQDIMPRLRRTVLPQARKFVLNMARVGRRRVALLDLDLVMRGT